MEHFWTPPLRTCPRTKQDLICSRLLNVIEIEKEKEMLGPWVCLGSAHVACVKIGEVH